MVVTGKREFGKMSVAFPADSHSLRTEITLDVNGQSHALDVDSRETLLDVLRERLTLSGTKKGCDHGQCGACTIHLDGRRKLACLTFAIAAQHVAIVTIEGLATDDELHPMQRAFIECDALQCGYCTPGQIMSAIGCVNEGRTNDALAIAEAMSGNLCRCGAYPNIREAIVRAAV